MKIQAISQSFKQNFKGNTKSQEAIAETQKPCASCQDALAAQNAILVKKLEPFFVENLPDKGIKDTFTDAEMWLPEGGICISDIFSLTSSYMADQVRHIYNNGEMIPYKVAQLKEEAQRLGLNEQGTAEFLENSKQKFINEYLESKKRANETIDKTAPTTSEHEVYRVIHDYNNPQNAKFFERIKGLKAGKIEKLDCVPIYVSTSGKKTMKNYGGKLNGAILFKIVLPEGSKLFKFLPTDGIEQCIMKADAEFEVIENKEFQDNFRLITLKYLP